MSKSYLVIALIFILSGCKQEEKEQITAPVEPRVTNVKTTIVESFSGGAQLPYTGLVEAKETTPLSFKTGGTVIKILVDEGQFVKKGQLLATLDDANIRSSYELALQSRLQAQDAYDRMKPMKENGTLPEINWVEVETGLNQAIIAADMAKRNIDNSNLYAPKSGVIGNKSILLGMNIMPSVTAFDLMDISKVYVNIPVPEGEVGQLRKGQKAEINIAATSQMISGKVEQIGVVANAISHTYPVKILVDNKDWKIKPGMVCNVSIKTEKIYDGLKLSSKAIMLDNQGEQYVYLVQDSAVSIKPVSVSTFSDNRAVINGLDEGAVVVISGQDKLRDGALINVINNK